MGNPILERDVQRDHLNRLEWAPFLAGDAADAEGLGDEGDSRTGSDFNAQLAIGVDGAPLLAL